MSAHAYTAEAAARARARAEGEPPSQGPGAGRPLALAAAGVLALMLLWVLAELVPSIHYRDAQLLYDLTKLDTSGFESVGLFILHLLNPLLFIIWGIALVSTAIARGRERVAVAVVVVMALAPLTSELLKPILAHPHASVGGVYIAAASWPSGHATAAAALGLSAVLVAPERARGLVVGIAVAFALLVGFLLLVLAWHMPSDVLGGYLVAAVWGALAVAGLRFSARARSGR